MTTAVGDAPAGSLPGPRRVIVVEPLEVPEALPAPDPPPVPEAPPAREPDEPEPQPA